VHVVGGAEVAHRPVDGAVLRDAREREEHPPVVRKGERADQIAATPIRSRPERRSYRRSYGDLFGRAGAKARDMPPVEQLGTLKHEVSHRPKVTLPGTVSA